MSYFTLSQRKMLDIMLKDSCTFRDIAPVIQKAISSISHEIKVNGEEDGSYDAYKAHYKAEQRKLQKRKRKKIEISLGLLQRIIFDLEKDWSPEQIAGTLKEEAGGRTIISHETIYQYIYSEEGKRQKLWKHLRHKKKPYRQSWGTRKKRFQIEERVSIHHRPHCINRRERFGDYEGDLMLFSSSEKALAVFVERKTRKVFITLNANKTARAMEMALHELLCSAGIRNVHSITFDNGGENTCHERVRREYCSSFQTYFCDPYSSWQKGTVENTNKLLRQYFPRDIDPNLLTQDFVDTIAEKLNNRPRKCLHFSTPSSVFISCSD